MIHLKHYNEIRGRGLPAHTHCGLLLNKEGELDGGKVILDGETIGIPAVKLNDLSRDAAVALDASNRNPPLNERDIDQVFLDQAAKVGVCTDCFSNVVREKTYTAGPRLMTKEERKQFILDWLGNRIFSSCHAPDDNPFTAFMVLSLMPPIPPDYTAQVGLVWEYYDKAMPRSVNGMPSFFSCQMMHKEDWDKIRPVLQRELDRQTNLEVD